MTRNPAPIRAFTYPWRALAAAALTTLALAGCGMTEPNDSEVKGKTGKGVNSEVSAIPPTAEEKEFSAMLEKVAQPCSTTDRNASGPTSQKPTGSERQQSLAPGETPPNDPIEPGSPTGPDAALNERDQCASVQHEQRVIAALQTVPEPTLAKVRKTLNGLGYINERIHDLKQDGKTTRFYLDLRANGGRLCEAGLAAGEQSDVTACVAPATGVFIVEAAADDTGV